MSNTVKAIRLALGQALAAGMLAASFGLFWFYGSAPVSAQADTTPPTVYSIAVTSDTGDGDSYYDDDGVYGIGDSIEVTVTFSEDVSVIGTPRLELDIGSVPKSAEYERAQGSAVMFGYTVAEGDRDSDGIAIEADKLTLNGGSIKDSADNDANMPHNALPAQEDHRVDGIRPTIWRVYLSGGFGKPYTVGNEIFVDVEFTESASISGRPQLTLDFDGTPYTSEWSGGWRGSFSYAIQEGDRDSDGVAIGANAISLNGGTVRDGAGNDAVLTHGAVAAVSRIKVDAVAPTVSSIAITSDPGEDDTYDTGDQIEVTVTFSEFVDVWRVTRGDPPGSDRKPQLELDIGGEARTAEYQSFTGAEVVFDYTVQDGDTDENGIAIGANKLALNGGAIFDYAENHPIGAGIDFWDVPLDAVVSHDAVSDDAGHKIAGSSSSLTLSGDTTLRILENSSSYVAGYWVSGTDGSLTLSLSGDDSDDFKISSGGTVNWVSSPNYEDPTDADKDNRYRVTIQASDGTNEVKLQVTVVVINMPVDSDEVPTVTGTAQVGETLTADTSLISFSRYGPGPGYFWLRSEGTTDTEIEGARGNSTYPLVAADEGYTIKVRVNFSNNKFVSLTSEPTAVVAADPNSPANSPATGAPTISGTAYVGNTLTADTSSISDADGLTNRTFSHQWIRNDQTADADISGATGATYTLVEADEGKNIKVRVSFTDDASIAETLTSAPTATVVVNATPLTGLTVNPGTLTPAFHTYTFNYEVPDVANSDSRITVNATVKDGYEHDIAPVEGESVAGAADPGSLSGWNINDGSGNAFEPLIDADADSPGFQIDVDEGENSLAIRAYQGRDDFGEFYWLTITRAPGLPDAPQHLSVSRHDSGALDLYWEAPPSNGGSEITGYKVQWKEAAGSWDSAADVSETTETGTTHTITGLDDGVEYAVRVVAANEVGDGPASVEQTATPQETVAPELTAARVDGDVLTLTYDEVLDESSELGANAFVVTAGGATREVDSVTVAGSAVALTLASAVVSGDAVAVSYTAPTDPAASRTMDSVGNAAASFSGRVVVNETVTAVEVQPAAPPEGPPDQPTGTAVFIGGVDLEWNEVEGAESYDVQLYRNGGWIDLPGDGVEISFYGAGAIISGLNHEGSSYWFRVQATNAVGSSDWSPYSFMSTTSEFDSGERIRPSNVSASGAPVITGTAQAGETLAADAADITDGNGLERVNLHHQWVASDGNTDTDITGATDSTYTLAAADQGKTIKVRVSFTDRGGYPESVTSAATGVVAPSTQATSEPAQNSPATGIPTITGTAQVGETLTADTSGIADTDGLTNVAYSYQWVANDGTSDTTIAGATGSTYTLVAADEGKTIKVRVKFTDDAGYSETLTSATTIAVEPEAGGVESRSYITVVVTRDPLEPSTADNVITNFNITWSDADDCSTNYNGYLNIEPGHETPGDQIHLGSAASDTAQIAKELSGVQDNWWGFDVELYCGTGGSGRLISRVYIPLDYTAGPKPGTYSTEPPLTALSVSHGTLTPTFNKYASDYTVPDVANADTRITITATSKTGYTVDFFETSGVGQGVFAVVVHIFAMPPADCSRSYSDGLNPLPELADADPNTPGFQVDLYDGVNDITAWVYPTDYCDPGNGYYLEVIRAEGSVTLVRPNKPATGIPYIDGMARDRVTDKSSPWVGFSLSAVVSGIHDRDGLDKETFSYQWFADDAEIAGATSSSYTVASSDLDKALKVRVTYTDDAGHEETVYSNATEVVRLPNSEATGKPIILGTAEVGETLSADVSGISDANGLTNATFRYEWFYVRGPISHGEEYTPVAADEGRTIRVLVTYTDDDGHGEKVYSDATAAVAARSNSPATGVPAITGTAQVGETLTADILGIADADGMTNVSYSYQWITNDGSSDTDITGATDSTYSLVAADEGKTIKVRVSFNDDAGNDESLTSTATVAVAAAEPQEPPAKPRNLEAVVNGDGTVTLTWDDPGDASITGYQILRRDRDASAIGVFEVHVGDTGSAATSYIDRDVTPETRYNYRVKARNESGLSVRSNFVKADTPSAPNSPATGSPAIGGTAKVGQTLTADTSGIADADGLDNATFSYQWLANNADISGATASTYTLTDADEGKAVKVRVSFTDDAGNAEALTSAATEEVSFAVQEQVANSTATGAPMITGMVQVGETLTADTAGIIDADGLTNVSYGYQWVDNDGTSDTDITGATDSTYTLAASDEGKTIKVRVSFTDDTGNDESLTSTATTAVEAKPNSPATGVPAIGGTARVGETLTAGTAGITDDDGLTNVSYGYQWVANDGTSDTHITGATNSTYTLLSADEGKTIAVRVSFTDDAGYDESLTSTATTAVEAKPNSPATGSPTITGTVQVGETLTADTSGIADADGLTNVSYGYQWLVDNVEVQGATQPAYTLAVADEGKTVKLRVSFTDDAGYDESLTISATAAVEAKPNNPATGVPAIAGTAQVGETLTADTSGIADADGLTNVSYGYQWLVDNVEVQGATQPAYTLAVADEGKTVKLRVSFTDDAGYDESLTSSATAAVEAKPNNPATGVPAIAGTAQVEETLTADTSGIADADGLTNVSYGYQWLADDVEVQGATEPNYTLVSPDEGKTIKVRVSFTDDAGNEESLTSLATAAVEAEPVLQEPPAKPAGLTGTVAYDAVSLTWDDPDDASITGYQILRRNRVVDAPGKFQVHVDDTGSSATSYVDRDVTPETRYVYRIKARNAGGLGGRSGFFNADTPPAPNHPATGAPRISGTARVGETLTADTTGIEDSDGMGNANFSYQWVATDGGTDLDIQGATEATYTLIDIDAALRFMVRVSFTDDRGNEETLTSEATGVVAK